MKTRRKKRIILVSAAVVILLLAGIVWKLSRAIPEEEAALRQKLVQTAEKYLGCNELDGSHQKIIDLYNAHEPLAQNYEVQYTDSWCATFGSAVAIECGMDGIIPTECSCQRQIGLFQDMGCWEERDSYLPYPGDYIFYAWDDAFWGDCTGWADHVGIVVDTFGPVIKVIEGNKDDCVAYRYILVNHPSIRGYGLPDYRKLV